VSRVLAVDGPFGQFSRRLLSAELPGLPPDRLDETVDFVCRRASQTPGPPGVGLMLLTGLTGLSSRVLDADRVTSFLRATSLPFVAELARLVRSLAFAFVWETWPTTGPTGAPGAP
jgi:hypothetical protein